MTDLPLTILAELRAANGKCMLTSAGRMPANFSFGVQEAASCWRSFSPRSYEVKP